MVRSTAAAGAANVAGFATTPAGPLPWTARRFTARSYRGDEEDSVRPFGVPAPTIGDRSAHSTPTTRERTTASAPMPSQPAFRRLTTPRAPGPPLEPETTGAPAPFKYLVSATPGSGTGPGRRCRPCSLHTEAMVGTTPG